MRSYFDEDCCIASSSTSYGAAIRKVRRVVDTAIDLGFVQKRTRCGRWRKRSVWNTSISVRTEVDLSLLKDFPHKLIHRQSLFPVRRNNGELVVATSDPFDLYPLDELSAATGLSVIPVLARARKSPS